MGVDVAEAVGVNVSVGGKVVLGVNAMVTVLVAVGSGKMVSVAPAVAVTTIITGDEQLH